MNSIAAENRELALSISINQRNPHRAPKNPARGYYLALTFGTLLSSQRADAQKLHPRRGLVPGWMSNTTPVSSDSPPGGLVRQTLAVRAAHGEQYTTERGSCTGVGETP